MRNKFIKYLYVISFIFLILEKSHSEEIFNFDVTEIEILENGNKFIGKKGGTAKSNDGKTIKAENFLYDKNKNILIAIGNVEINDKIDDVTIYSDKITYYKNEELVLTDGNSRAVNDDIEIDADKFNYNKKRNILDAKGSVKVDNLKDNYLIYSDKISYRKNEEKIISRKNSKAITDEIIIDAENFNFDRRNNILNASGNVKIDDKIENYLIYSNFITYYKNENKVITKGKTRALLDSSYIFNSKNVILNRNIKEIKSKHNSTIEDDKQNKYKLSSFKYSYEKKFLKGKNLEIITNYLSDKSDKFYFSSAFIDFNDKSYTSKDTRILLHKKLFDKEREINDDQKNVFLGQNDPRIYGSSSMGNEKKVIINKGVFTSCKINDNCPPWSIKADKITHDKVNKNIHYNNAILNLYDIPVFYFPKFFHPDPSVDRRSGLLQPRLNNSNVLGSSLNIPYFHVISENKDITFKPTIFDNRIYMFQNEYRQENENSSFIADFSYTKGYQSNISGSNYSNRNSISHLFSKFDLDLGLKNFNSSKIKLFIEKVSNDTYLKVFENVLLVDKKFETDLNDKNNLTSGVELTLDNENFDFISGFTTYENLQKINNDRYQYVFPYYNFSSTIFSNEKGSLNFSSDGRNSLSNTNNLRSTFNNSLNYSTKDLYNNKGFVNNFGLYFKNINATGKNDTKYKSSLQSEILNIYEFNSKIPLIKINEKNTNYIIPKISFRINPSDMKNHSGENRLITTDNIFDINRLGISDSFEAGKSLTLGIDYKKESIDNNDKYFEAKIATVLRDSEENKISKTSTLNRTTSNLFGSIENSFSEFFKLNYDFALDNNFNQFEHNSIEAEFKINNFITTFNFLEKNGEIGDVNTLENISEINFDEKNSLIFKTRRNRKISLTEYYDLVYEYQNDCLTAGIKYRKTYYQDRDLKPKEDLFFTITLFPLTTLDQKIDQQLYR